MRAAIHVIGISAVAATAALLIVGVASGEIARHVVQTAPLWPAAILGLVGSSSARWAGTPFLFWVVIVVLIWAYLLHLSTIVSGTFTPVEIAMTVIVALASVAGLGASAAVRTVNVTGKFAIAGWASGFLLFLVQIAAMQVSLRPPFENDALFLDWIAR